MTGGNVVDLDERRRAKTASAVPPVPPIRVPSTPPPNYATCPCGESWFRATVSFTIGEDGYTRITAYATDSVRCVRCKHKYHL